MTNDETTRYYESPFAAHMADFIRYKRAQGLKHDAVRVPCGVFRGSCPLRKRMTQALGKS